MTMVGTGTTVTFASGFCAEVLDVKGPDMKRKEIETSHMLTSKAHTFVPGDLYDAGGLTVDIAFDPSDMPPIDHDPETVTITFPDTGSATWAFTGFMTGFSPSTPLEDRATAQVTIKASGEVTVTP